MNKWLEHTKIVLLTVGLSIVAISGIAAVVFAIPIIIGIAITLLIYVSIRILMEDVDN